MNFKCLKVKERGVWDALKIKVMETFLQKDQTEKLKCVRSDFFSGVTRFVSSFSFTKLLKLINTAALLSSFKYFGCTDLHMLITQSDFRLRSDLFSYKRHHFT